MWARGPGEMKLSGAGFMPLAVSWECKWEESGRRWEERGRCSQPQRNTGRKRRWHWILAVWWTSTHVTKTMAADKKKRRACSLLMYGTCSVFPLKPVYCPFLFLMCPLDSVNHAPIPLHLFFSFSHPPSVLPSPPSSLLPPQDFMILFNDRWEALDSIFSSARNPSFSESNIILSCV